MDHGRAEKPTELNNTYNNNKILETTVDRKLQSFNRASAKSANDMVAPDQRVGSLLPNRLHTHEVSKAEIVRMTEITTARGRAWASTPAAWTKFT